MVGKFFLFAFVCVSAVQIRGDPLETAIKRGLLRTQSIYRNGERRIEAAINEVQYKIKLIESKSADFVEKADRIHASFEAAVNNAAETSREKARQSKRPQSVFECIDKVEENAIKNVESLTSKFTTDVERLERVKLENIRTYAKPLSEMTKALKARHEKADSIIQDCQTVECVDIAITSFSGWLDMLSSEMSRIRSQINIAVTNFQRDANTFFNNSNRQISRIKNTALRNIRLCFLNRQGIAKGIFAMGTDSLLE